MKKNVLSFLLGVFLFFGASEIAFAENSNILEIGRNAKTSTYVNLLTKDFDFPVDDAFEFCMNLGRDYADYVFQVDIYNTVELLTELDDNYIYGTAVMAVVQLNYGFAQIEYFKYDDEPRSVIGWDVFFIIAMDNGQYLTVRFFNPIEQL